MIKQKFFRIRFLLILLLFLFVKTKQAKAEEFIGETSTAETEYSFEFTNAGLVLMEQDNRFRRFFTRTFTSKAERTSQSQRHSNRPKRYSPPESNSRNPESYGGRRSDLPSSDISTTQNQPKLPLQPSLRDTYLYKGSWEMGLSLGTTHALTDIADNKALPPGEFLQYHTKNYDLSFGFFGRYKMSSWFAIKLGAEYSSISAENMAHLGNPDIPAVSFENEIFEFYGRTEFMLPALARSPVDIYGFVGIGIFFTDAQLFDQNNLPVQVPDDYSQVQPLIPIGFGANVRVTERLKLGYEFGWRNTIFHYLDGIKVPSNSYDRYFVNQLKISYMF
jgi:hypothetical protein